MIITYFGKQFFKITQGELVVAFNPVSKASKGGSLGHFGADIALVTTNHSDYNGVDELSHGGREPFVINSPGGYEVKSIFIRGMASFCNLAGKEYINTIYSLSIDNIKVVFLGTLSGGEISKEAKEEMNGADILFVPVGGKDLIDSKTSAKLAASLEPSMIIPMDYDDASLKLFLKELGEEKAETVDKLTLKRKDLDGKEGEVVVLKPV